MTVRIALVGYGLSGREFHLPLLSACGATPAVVVTGNADRAAQARADLPGVQVVPDLHSALAGGGVDLVVIASASGAHAANALACVSAGVPFVVDKPLAVDAASAGAVVDAAQAAQVPMTVFQNRRWDAENLTLAALLEQGRLGTLHRFERRWERWRPVPKDRWRENASAGDGGGLLLDLHSHLVDAAILLFGPVEEVYAEVAAWTTPAEDDAFVALLHAPSADGVRVRSHVSATSVAAAPGPRTRVLGSAAAYVVTEFEAEPSGFAGPYDNAEGCTGWLVEGSQTTAVPTAPGSARDYYPAVIAAVQEDGYEAQQRAMPVDPRDAVRVLTVIDAARRSAAEHQVVRLDPA